MSDQDWLWLLDAEGPERERVELSGGLDDSDPVKVRLQLLVGNSVGVLETVPVLAVEDGEKDGPVPVGDRVPEYDPVAEKVRVGTAVALEVALKLPWLALCDRDPVPLAVADAVPCMDRLWEPVGEKVRVGSSVLETEPLQLEVRLAEEDVLGVVVRDALCGWLTLRVPVREKVRVGRTLCVTEPLRVDVA